MFEHHRKSPWFAEKYDPTSEYENLRVRVRKEGWKGRLNTFLDDIESGKFDHDVDENDAELASTAKESTGAEGGPDANGDATTISSEEIKPVIGGDDDIQFNADVDEELGDHDVARTEANGKSSFDNRRNTRGEEVSVPPEGNQVMIRTIPPDIGRVKLEEVGYLMSQINCYLLIDFQACSRISGYIYLALGDPLQKRNYYRAGWLRFQDDTDMASVIAELSEKKVTLFIYHFVYTC